MPAYGVRIGDWSSDVCSSDLVADQHAPPDLFRDIRSRAMRGGSEEADRRAGLAFGDLGKPEIRLRHARFAVALREDARCAIVRGAGGERPKDIDQIFLTAVSAEIGRASWRERVGQYV